MRKKVIKAHRGMAHVPRADGADRSMRKQGPTKGRGRPPTGGRMIGLPQRFRGRGRNPLSGIIKQAPIQIRDRLPKFSPPKVAQPISQDSFMRQPKAPTTEVRSGRPSRPMPTTAVKAPSIPTTSVPKSVATERPKLTLGTVSDNRRTRRPPRPINELYRRGGRPIPLSTLLRRNRVKDSRKRQAQGMATSRGRNPRIGSGTIGSAMPTMSAPLIRYNGGYVSRAKYGQTDNLKGKK